MINSCPSPAEYVVTGLAEDVHGSPVVVVIGACSRHVLAVKGYLQEWEELTGEPVVVCGVERWKKVNAEALGGRFPVQQLVAANG